jgi:transposase-like protein
MAIHDRVQRTDRQPAGDGLSNWIPVDETMMQVGGERNWLCAAVDPVTEGFADTAVPDANGTTHVSPGDGTFLRPDDPA